MSFGAISDWTPSFLIYSAETKHYTESETDSNVVILVAALVGVLGTVAIGLIVAVVIISRRRTSAKKGASLIVAEEI